jgi:hypothetical protein
MNHHGLAPAFVLQWLRMVPPSGSMCLLYSLSIRHKLAWTTEYQHGVGKTPTE